MAIDLWSSRNFPNIKNIIKTYNLTIIFLKFIFNIKIYEESVEFLSVDDVFVTRAENVRTAQISSWVF